jgi:hypothetical protein
MTRPSARLWPALFAALSACASVVNGTNQTVRFESNPPAATARVGGASVVTPGELSLARKNTYDVQFEKPGYLPARSHIGQDTSGWLWGNLIIGGLMGVLVDTSSGAAYNLTPETVSVVLVPEPGVGPQE